jgi:hypothetical protein
MRGMIASRGAIAALAVVGVCLIGCANPYKQFYQGMTREQISSSPLRVAPAPEPRIVQGSGLSQEAVQADGLRLMENGFDRVGHSSFNAAAINADGAIE